jgi:hypothetical protein
MPADRSPFTHTRLAHVSPGVALGLLLGLILMICAGLAMRPSGTPGGAAGGGDASLYRQITARVAHGEAYYPAVAAEHRASGYPLKPFTAVRQPLLAEIAATIGPTCAEWLLRLLAVAATAATVIRLAPRLKAPFREIAILLSATSAGAFVQHGMWVWHEIWAGLLITLALACRTERHWLFSVALGLTAALLRELAFPFLLVMAGAAWTSGGRREAGAWIVAAAIALTALALHMISVGAVALPTDVTSPGWLVLGGWRFDLALARQSSLLLMLPNWVTAVVTPLALLGWWAWPDAYARRTVAILGLWMAAFLVFGRPDNSYWGFLFAPLLPVGLALAPAALRDLVRASRPLLAGAATTPVRS